jgi:two-component sensor histidine kinase
MRVNLFADIHQRLYRTGNDKVDLEETISSVTNDLVSAYCPARVGCRIEVSPSFVWLTDMAVPVIMLA